MGPRLMTVCVIAAGLSAGCVVRSENGGQPAPGPTPEIRVTPVLAGSRKAVEEYLRAASEADGATMYGLLATSERKRESPETLHDTAKDRYSPATRWEVLKTEETGSTSQVTVEFKGADVDPNPSRFTLTRENDEWRIVDSPELHEREKDGRLRIKF